MTTNREGTTRRGFMAACGAAAAATALPAVAIGEAAGSGEKLRTPPRTALLEAWRALYRVELETLAEQLRPRFEAGQLRAFRDEDERVSWDEAPHGQLEDLAAEYFGLGVKTRDDGLSVWKDENPVVAHMILAVSPHAACTGGGAEPPAHAAEAAAWDLIAIARARRWYVPTEEESEDPVPEVLS